jgi:glycosyltransferase involved in cell wall biosynthesis
MAWGIPVVATSVAAEGMGLQHERDLLIADSAPDFARAIARLYRDETLWNRLSAAGRENIQRHFSRDAAKRTLNDLIGEAVSARNTPVQTSKK